MYVSQRERNGRERETEGKGEGERLLQFMIPRLVSDYDELRPRRMREREREQEMYYSEKLN